MSAPAWSKTSSGADRLEVGCFVMIVRPDKSWSLIENGVHVCDKDATTRYGAKKAAIDAARERCAKMSSALDVASANLEPRA